LLLADEPTGHLDAETAHDVRQGLLALAAQGRTLVVATHDPLLAAQMDRTVTLNTALLCSAAPAVPPREEEART
ncbi:thiol reductant ABC exporter subunit CydD, partial [Ramlibacter sp. H39-3-26]|nr:thiol reductant ABC exporter subunit CydD [Ramlibacter sp. H39-3-26]